MKTNDELLEKFDKVIQYFIHHDANASLEFSDKIDELINIKSELANDSKKSDEVSIDNEALLEIGDQQVNRIIQEEDPIKREIWAQGYTHIEEDPVQHKILLINKNDKYIKKIDLDEYRQCLMNLKFCVGANMAGSLHKWIKEADGSADRFRRLILACF